MCLSILSETLEVLNGVFSSRLVTSAGGGFRESKRASDLSEILGVNISPLQVIFYIAYKLRS